MVKSPKIRLCLPSFAIMMAFSAGCYLGQEGYERCTSHGEVYTHCEKSLFLSTVSHLIIHIICREKRIPVSKMFLSIKVVCKFLLVKSRISTFDQWLKNCCFADVDECSANSLLCRNGLCINMNGTYRCECNPGFQVSSDGKSCSRG